MLRRPGDPGVPRCVRSRGGPPPPPQTDVRHPLDPPSRLLTRTPGKNGSQARPAQCWQARAEATVEVPGSHLSILSSARIPWGRSERGGV